MNYENYIDEKKAEFESRILNKKIVSIKHIDKGSIKGIVGECKKRGFDYVVSQIDLSEFELINGLLDNGFRIYGYPIILKAKLDKDYNKSLKVREYKEADLTELKKITKGAFPNAHWYHDQHLNKEDVDTLYLKWLENSCNGRAEIVLVYEENSQILGYIACNKKSTIGLIDLIAVSNKAKKKGIGKALVDAAQDYFKKRNSKEMEVKTEITNITALNLYIKCGFRIGWVGLNIDKWLE